MISTRSSSGSSNIKASFAGPGVTDCGEEIVVEDSSAGAAEGGPLTSVRNLADVAPR